MGLKTAGTKKIMKNSDLVTRVSAPLGHDSTKERRWGLSMPICRMGVSSCRKMTYKYIGAVVVPKLAKLNSTTSIDFEEIRTPPFDSAPSKTPISEVSSKIDQVSKG